eukprot:scaffold29823_cov89-Phaeocystis_antarctica.AAC.2
MIISARIDATTARKGPRSYPKHPRWPSSSSIIELADLTKSGKTHWCRCLWCMRRRSPFIVVSSTPDDQKCSR